MIGNLNLIWHGLFLIISFYESDRAFVSQGEVVVVMILCFSTAFGSLRRRQGPGV